MMTNRVFKKGRSSEWDGDFLLGQYIMDKEVDSFLIEVSDDIFSSLSHFLTFVVSGEVSRMVVEGLFLSDSFLFLEKGVCLFLEVFVVTLN